MGEGDGGGSVSTVQRALAYALAKIGCRYSQADRWKSNVYDCSSLIYRAFQDAGYTFKSGSTSNTLVNDTAFHLIWPGGGSVLGQHFTSVAALKKAGYQPMAGDIIYLNTNAATTRKNKITHVVMVVNENTIVHARGTAYGVRKDGIDIYGGKVVAVTRFKEQPEKLRISFPAECTGDGVNIRMGPSTKEKSIGKLDRGDPLITVTGAEGWAAVATIKDGVPMSGYMSTDYIGTRGE